MQADSRRAVPEEAELQAEAKFMKWWMVEEECFRFENEAMAVSLLQPPIQQRVLIAITIMTGGTGNLWLLRRVMLNYCSPRAGPAGEIAGSFNRTAQRPRPGPFRFHDDRFRLATICRTPARCPRIPRSQRVQVHGKGRYYEFSKTYPFPNPAPRIVESLNSLPRRSRLS